MHIQNLSDAGHLEHHWGYPDRAQPCVKDTGTCEYLTAVYWMHDTSMLYTFILWAIVGALLITFIAIRFLRPKTKPPTKSDTEGQLGRTAGGPYYRGYEAIITSSRMVLLPETTIGVFGHATRLQVLTLSILLAYLLIFSMVGITYRTWHTPIKGSTYTNTRTGFGGFGDRVGALAYALTPLTVLLSTRESILSLLTGIPYQSFNFLHRWLGRIMLVQAVIHTFAWTLIEGNFYKPQPSTYKEFISEPYIVWGCIALALLFFLCISSMKSVAKLTGYEFFRRAHYILALSIWQSHPLTVASLPTSTASKHTYIIRCWHGETRRLGDLAKESNADITTTSVILSGPYGEPMLNPETENLLLIAGVYFGACWAHWDRLACWMIASLGILLLDRAVRLVRVALIHIGRVDEKMGLGFHPAQATIKYFEDEHGGVVRLDFYHNTSWKAGQHFFVCFPALSIWQSHPLTVASLPTSTASKHTYIIRCRHGETRRLGDLAKESNADITTTSVILSGPYGEPMLNPETENLLLIAGGTGITLTLPLAFAAMNLSNHRTVAMIWSVRHENDIQWVRTELDELRSIAIGSNSKLNFQIFITRDVSRNPLDGAADSEKTLEAESKEIDRSCLDSVKEIYTITKLADNHPDLKTIMKNYIEGRKGRTTVIGSGPASMGQDLRAAVAACNDGGKVWKGDESYNVELKWDNRG